MKKIISLTILLTLSLSTMAADHNRYSYELSKKGNCKLMLDGVYTGQNVDPSYCESLDYRYDEIRYEWSRKGYCKIMKNGVFIGHTDPYYCGVRP